MTLNELLQVPLEIEKLSESQLKEICEPYFKLTRPELANPEKKNGLTNSSSKAKTPQQRQEEFQLEQAKAIARSMGIKLK
jgi:hypothetical protein